MYEQRWDFPHCLGAVDGKHIRISKPKSGGNAYYNYKHFYSVILMAIANGNYEFLFVEVGAEGHHSDGGVWQTSNFKTHLVAPGNPLRIPPPRPLPGSRDPMPYVLVGDDAFAMDPNLLKPYKGRDLPPDEAIFNFRLSRARRTVENAFGIMAMRFRILLKTIENEPAQASRMVHAMCILHSFLRVCSPHYYMPRESYDEELDDGSYVPGDWRMEPTMTRLRSIGGIEPTQFARDKRDQLNDYFLGRGSRLWQYDKV